MRENNSKGQITAQVKLGDLEHSGFDLDNVQYGTGRIGRLYPVGIDHVLPADTMKDDPTAVLQFVPLAVPLMTNMHVKQESFYVPKNVVWDNFDEFISNGEENDYNGVEPNMSLYQMANELFSLLTQDNEYSIIKTGFGLPIFKVKGLYPDTPTQDYYNYYPIWVKYAYLGIDFLTPLKHRGQQIISNYETLVKQFHFENTPFGQWLKARQMDDLYEHVEPLFNKIYETIKNAYAAGVDTNGADMPIALFRTLQSYGMKKRQISVGNQEPAYEYLGGYQTYRELVESGEADKYLSKIYKSLDAYIIENSLDGFGLVPTETGLAVLRYLYEIYKPLFGLSSHLDMLNYNKLRFEDFLYVVLMTIMQAYQFIPNNETMTNVVSLETDGQMDICLGGEYNYKYLSEKPQSILPLRALYSIWFNNYRDQLIETKAPKLNKSDNITMEEIVVLLSPRLRCWHKDAYTTSLDNPGTGNVGVPITRDAGIAQNMIIQRMHELSSSSSLEKYAASNDMEIAEIQFDGKTWKLPTAFLSGLTEKVYSDVSVSGFSLYALSAAQRAQKWLQKALFYGNRMPDFLFTRFGVKFLDARLRLPELLATSSSMVDMQQIMANNTIVTDKSVNVAGDKAGFASAKNSGSYIDQYCPEHGFIITMLSVIPDTVYSNSFDRHLAALEQLDNAFPEFSTLGLQAVYENEMMQVPVKVFDRNADMTDDVAVHGYQGMYYADKSKFSCVHGELLDYDNKYVMDREFNPYDPDARPKLNHVFVHCHPKLDAFVIDNEWSDYFRFDVYHNQRVNRLLPVHSVYIS